MDRNPAVRPGEPDYDRLRSGFNTAVEHRPALVVDATGEQDVVAAVGYAARHGLAAAVMNTGHGPSVGADGAVLVRTGRMDEVRVDPDRRTARVGGGARWREVIDAAAVHGLAPLNGSSPAVGAVGYTLGGGIGPLSRRFGFAADHVHRIDLVTADARLRRVDAAADPELFWALRGAGAHFGIVTAMEVALFEVRSLLGGELCFPAGACEDVVHGYLRWTAGVPETMASSLMLLTYPDDPAVPAQLRGQHVTHIRVAYSGDDHDEGRHLVESLRRIAPPVVDTVRPMPYAEVGTIHHEPTDVPVPAYDRNTLLRAVDDDAAAVICELAGPAGAGFLVEVRAWGGALARPPAVPNAVGSRDAAFSVVAISDPDPTTRAARDEFLRALRPWATGTAFPNFCGVEDTSAEGTHEPADLARLGRLKSHYDPADLFRVNRTLPKPIAAAPRQPARWPRGRLRPGDELRSADRRLLRRRTPR